MAHLCYVVSYGHHRAVDCVTMAEDQGEREARKRLAALVKTIREDRGLSATDAADQAGLGRTTWTKMENLEGRYPLPQRLQLPAVARVLGVDVDLLNEAAGYALKIPDAVTRIVGFAERLVALEERMASIEAQLPSVSPDVPSETRSR